MPEAVRQQAERELGRLERMGDSNAEAAMIRTYPTGCSPSPRRSARRSASIRSARASSSMPITPVSTT